MATPNVPKVIKHVHVDDEVTFDQNENAPLTVAVRVVTAVATVGISEVVRAVWAQAQNQHDYKDNG